MKVSSELTLNYRNKHKSLFPSEEELSVMEGEGEQGRKLTKKRSHSAVRTSMNKRKRV